MATWPCCTGCRSTERDAVAGAVARRDCSSSSKRRLAVRGSVPLGNALDAGATQITVRLAAGGVRLISVKNKGSSILGEGRAIACLTNTTEHYRDRVNKSILCWYLQLTMLKIKSSSMIMSLRPQSPPQYAQTTR